MRISAMKILVLHAMRQLPFLCENGIAGFSDGVPNHRVPFEFLNIERNWD